MYLKVYKLIKIYEQEYEPLDFDLTDLMPLVFSIPKDHKTPVEISENTDILACPWPLFSVEVDGTNNFLTIDRIDKEIPGKNFQYSLESILVKELAPDDYIFYVSGVARLNRAELISHTLVAKVDKDSDNEIYNSLKSIMHVYLNKLYSYSNGKIQSKSFRFQKYKNKNKTYKYKPKEVIYVSNRVTKENANTHKTTQGNHINWLEGWSVRAHWRKLKNPDSFGKDRKGIRNVKGLTWISHYRKGEITTIKPRKVIT